MRLAGRLPVRARAVLTLLALGAIGLAALRIPASVAVPAATSGVSDVATFQAIVAKLRSGTPYYAAYGFELRRAGYPTRDAFNWRTPLLLSAMSAVPEAMGRVVLFALLLILCCVTLAPGQQPATAIGTAFAIQLGIVAHLAVPSSFFIIEAWAGVLVGISVCAYARRRRAFAVALGLLALFVRELAAPYCLACTIIAIANRRWRELAVWIGGACIYAAYYGWHLTQVSTHRLPTDFAHSSWWLGFGGLPFLLATVHWQGWLLVLPWPATTLALVLIVAGVADQRAPLHVRTASIAYVVFFLVAGQPFNNYWGLMAAPTWALASGYGVRTIVQAIRTAFSPLALSRVSREE